VGVAAFIMVNVAAQRCYLNFQMPFIKAYRAEFDTDKPQVIRPSFNNIDRFLGKRIGGKIEVFVVLPEKRISDSTSYQVEPLAGCFEEIAKFLNYRMLICGYQIIGI
jgi:hypothetical protein